MGTQLAVALDLVKAPEEAWPTHDSLPSVPVLLKPSVNRAAVTERLRKSNLGEGGGVVQRLVHGRLAPLLQA